MFKMRFATCICVLFFFLSCTKTIEKKKEQALVDAITNGRWIITQFKISGTDTTSIFNGYEFQFYEQGTVDAVYPIGKNTGTWVGNMGDLTITANFITTSDTLQQLNDVWKITDSDWDYVRANAQNGTKLLYMKKKS